MIIKKDKDTNEEIQPLEQRELVELLHEDIFKNCKHPLTSGKVNPNGPIPLEVCAICGVEIPNRFLSQEDIDAMIDRESSK